MYWNVGRYDNSFEYWLSEEFLKKCTSWKCRDKHNWYIGVSSYPMVSISCSSLQSEIIKCKTLEIKNRLSNYVLWPIPVVLATWEGKTEGSLDSVSLSTVWARTWDSFLKIFFMSSMMKIWALLSILLKMWIMSLCLMNPGFRCHEPIRRLAANSVSRLPMGIGVLTQITLML
jgi:hypothetical protein